jgi:hypothetical protein
MRAHGLPRSLLCGQAGGVWPTPRRLDWPQEATAANPACARLSCTTPPPRRLTVVRKRRATPYTVAPQLRGAAARSACHARNTHARQHQAQARGAQGALCSRRSRASAVRQGAAGRMLSALVGADSTYCGSSYSAPRSSYAADKSRPGTIMPAASKKSRPVSVPEVAATRSAFHISARAASARAASQTRGHGARDQEKPNSIGTGAPTWLSAKRARAVCGPELVAQAVQLLLRHRLGGSPRRRWPPLLRGGRRACDAKAAHEPLAECTPSPGGTPNPRQTAPCGSA